MHYPMILVNTREVFGLSHQSHRKEIRFSNAKKFAIEAFKKPCQKKYFLYVINNHFPKRYQNYVFSFYKSFVK